jgi:hypothetical protein
MGVTILCKVTLGEEVFHDSECNGQVGVFVDYAGKLV